MYSNPLRRSQTAGNKLPSRRISESHLSESDFFPGTLWGAFEDVAAVRWRLEAFEEGQVPSFPVFFSAKNRDVGRFFFEHTWRFVEGACWKVDMDFETFAWAWNKTFWDDLVIVTGLAQTSFSSLQGMESKAVTYLVALWRLVCKLG